MLLPSDVARLVLGYLQQEGLSATSRAFIHESPNLREYAEHSTEDGTVPACVFSLFGKNLITILNEYVAVKAKETCQESQIPPMMTSLWKKLDFTLNQIRSLQNSPAVQQIQRLRTQNGIQNMRRQRPPMSSQPPNISVSTPGNCVASSIVPPQGMLGHSTPVCYTSQQARASTISLSQPGETTLQILVPDHRFTPGPLSPARRKCDSPRRRGGSQNKNPAASSVVPVELQNQEAVTENLSQMVIENAREKILNDRSLQEKLAENINKILASENSPQISKAACSAVVQEQSIDEILGLQGEIHMTDDAIQDILEQTESDPAFQALFDLFDYGKNKGAEEMDQADESFSNSAQESDETGYVDSATDADTVLIDSTSGGESSSRKLRSQNASDSKSKRKPAAPLSTGRPSPAPSQSCLSGGKRAMVARGTKKGTGRSKATLGTKQARNLSAACKKKADSKSLDKSAPSSSPPDEVVSMQVDDPDAENPQKQQPATQKSSQSSNVDEKSKNEASAVVGTDGSEIRSELEKTTSSVSEHSKDADQSQPSLNASDKTSSQPNTIPLLDMWPHEKESSSSVQSPGTTLSNNATPVAPSSSSTSVVVSDPKSTEPDPSKIVSLKIIISDEKEEQQQQQNGSGGDLILNQAVSSITCDNRIPTIFLSSPVKSPARPALAPIMALPPPPPPQPTTSSVTLDETAQAVNSLQEVVSAQTGMQPSPARPATQETGFFQLLPANATFAGPSGYFVVTEAAGAASEQHSSVMLLPGSATATGHGASAVVTATPPRSRAVVSVAANVTQTFSPASTIIISSPVQPMLQNMLQNVSVFGQNNSGKLAVLPNQVVTLSAPALVNQPTTVIPKPILAPKDHVELGKVGASGSSPSHRRILCFDENQTNTTASSGAKQLTGAEKVQLCPSGVASSKKNLEVAKLREPNRSSGTKVVKKSSRQQENATQITQTEAGNNHPANVPSQLEESSRLKTANSKLQPSSEDDAPVPAGTTQSSKSATQASRHKDSSREEKRDKRLPKAAPEDPSEKRGDDAVSPTIANANKENEADGVRREVACPVAAPPSSEKLATPTPRSPLPQGTSGKPLSKTSPLTKQAVEMLQDIQSHQSPISTPPRKNSNKSAIGSDLPLPRTPGPGRVLEDFVVDGLRTPMRHRAGRVDPEGTPRHLVPPTTPDIPTCSPASETGSENSINMAAHTLMILSRAARTGAPLKDSLRQEEASVSTSSSGKSGGSKGKKRKHVEQSPMAKKELQLSGSSGSKKKSKKQKKLLDSFPLDLDVDKFLSSLHYDE